MMQNNFYLHILLKFYTIIILSLFCQQCTGRGCVTYQIGTTWEFNNDQLVLPSVGSSDLCAGHCFENPSCKGYTWYSVVEGSHNICILFNELRNQHKCSDCESGTGPIGIPGACEIFEENLIDYYPAESELECYQKCSWVQDCEYYTWFDETATLFKNECFLFTDCEKVAPCKDCESGELTCLSVDCPSYKVLDDPTRNMSYGTAPYCDSEGHESDNYTTSPDWFGPGWYRFQLPAGNRMPESPENLGHCGASSPGWVSGHHPSRVGEVRNETICFKLFNDCSFGRDVSIMNCGDYMLYYLVDAPACNLRYCSLDQAQTIQLGIP